MNALCLSLVLLAVGSPPFAGMYFVDGAAPNASDDNPGSADAPWRTIARAGKAAELQPGDTVRIRSGVYREHIEITVSGTEGAPITFEAEPGGVVVVKGSEIIQGPWTEPAKQPDVKEPFPNAFTGVFQTQLTDDFFTDPRFTASYADPATRWVSQVFVDDRKPLQRIGLDPIYNNDEYEKLTIVGRDISDLSNDSFYFDPATQTLSVKLIGRPEWSLMEVGVRGFTLTAQEVHDVVIRGIDFRHNRQPGGQWPMASISGCDRVIVEDCSFALADFCGLGLGRSRDCVVRRCDLSHNGDTGLGMGECEDCLIEECTLNYNNYRRFSPGWHAGGMKCIPNNKRCTIRHCEAAYNTLSDGIWFDSANEDIRIIENVAHHNGSCGIFYEINPGGGIIAGNLCYANQVRGIYISGSQNTWVVHNTVAGNIAGIVCMPREDPFTLENVQVRNNLLIGNTTAATDINRGCDLTVYMGPSPDTFERTATSNHSDYNVYASMPWTPHLRHHWNPDNTLAEWQERFGEDTHSAQMPVSVAMRGGGFALLSTDGLDIAGPLPEGLPWMPETPGRVGSAITRWPAPWPDAGSGRE